MPSFTTRVELHNAGYNDYETLHAAMAAEGFTRTITSNDGITYQLPTAEYNCSGNANRGVVLECAKRAATRTGKRFAVLAFYAVPDGLTAQRGPLSSSGGEG